jgi:hypothetical protein
VVRIIGFHPIDPGSSPGVGELLLVCETSKSTTRVYIVFVLVGGNLIVLYTFERENL